MAYNETGHYKNVANLNLLVEHIISYNGNYVPTKQSITLSRLQDTYAVGNEHIQFVQGAKNNYSGKVDHRQDIFKDIKKFTTQIIANLHGTNVTPQTIDDAKTIAAKIRGTRMKKLTMPSNPININPASTSHSVSRQSYHSLYENFNDLVSLLSSVVPQYDPAKPEFQIPQLTAYAGTLLLSTETLDTAVVEVLNKRIDRDTFLYHSETGLVNAALAAKEYIKGLYGASSPQYKAVRGIRFRNIT